MTELEEKVKLHFQKQGYDVLRTGWPDFLCRKRKPGYGFEYRAVEVKTCKDDVRPNQQDMLLSLADMMPTIVLHETKEGGIFEEHIRWWIPKYRTPEFDGLGVS